MQSRAVHKALQNISCSVKLRERVMSSCALSKYRLKFEPNAGLSCCGSGERLTIFGGKHAVHASCTICTIPDVSQVLSDRRALFESARGLQREKGNTAGAEFIFGLEGLHPRSMLFVIPE